MFLYIFYFSSKSFNARRVNDEAHLIKKKENPVNTDEKQTAIVKMWGVFWNYELNFNIMYKMTQIFLDQSVTFK